MNRRHKVLCLALTIVGLSCAAPYLTHRKDREIAPATSPRNPIMSQELTIAEVRKRLWNSGRNATFAPTSEIERTTLGKLVRELLGFARAESHLDMTAVDDEARAVGFHVEQWNVVGHSYLALLELPERARGAGAYVFRIGAINADHAEVLLQAPHVYHDLGTGELAVSLFFASPVEPAPRALFVNTIHRYPLFESDGKTRIKSKDSPADVCHSPDHGFQAATVAALTTLGRAVLIQLHAFATRDDDGRAVASDTSLVISSGDRQALSSHATVLARRLAEHVTGVKRFPEEISELGATTNVQKMWMRGRPGLEFVHVELSPALRDTLKDAKLRDDFGRALLAPEASGASP